MLSVLWWLPLIVAVVAVGALGLGARRLRAEADALGWSAAETAQVRPLVAALRQDIDKLAEMGREAAVDVRRAPSSGRPHRELEAPAERVSARPDGRLPRQAALGSGPGRPGRRDLDPR